MFSLSSIAVFATLALTSVTSALPLNTPAGNLPVDLPDVSSLTGALPVPRDLPIVGSALPALPDLSAVTGTVTGLAGSLPLPVRADVQSIAVIVTTAQSQLAPLTAQLKFVNAQNATVDACSGPIGEIKDILTGTVSALQGLVGQPVEVILASVEGTAQITVQELGQIVAGLITIVFEALGAVLTVAGATIDKVLFDLLATVGALVGTILALVFQLVGTVLGDLCSVIVPLLATVIPFVMQLNLAEVVSILHL